MATFECSSSVCKRGLFPIAANILYHSRTFLIRKYQSTFVMADELKDYLLLSTVICFFQYKFNFIHKSAICSFGNSCCGKANN